MISATSNAAAVIAKLQNYRVKVHGAGVEIRNRLCDVGAEEARTAFAGAEYAGDLTVDVTTTQNGKVSSVVAKGQGVAFMEFGAGISAGQGYPGERPDGIVGLGEYGDKKGANPKGWIYRGLPGNSGIPVPNRPGRYRTKGNPPVAGMYAAARKMEEDCAEVAEEVFR